MVRISDIDDCIQIAEYRMKLGQPVETAYPKLHCSGFRDSVRDLKNVVNWLWLQTHKGSTCKEAANVVAKTVDRSLSFYGALEWEESRDKNDYLLINAAVLAGGADLIAKVLDVVSVADLTSGHRNYYWRSLTGILKFMITGEKAQAERQFEILRSCKGKDAPIRAAKKTVLKAFLLGDAKAMRRQIKSVTEDFWKGLEQSQTTGIRSRESDVKLWLWDDNRYWPWPEATILKFMCQNGAEVHADEFWIPPELIHGRG